MPDTPTTRPVSPIASSMAIWVEDMQTMRSASPLEHLTGEIRRNLFVITGNEQVRSDAVGALPRVRDGNQYALFAVCTFYVKPRSVFRCIDRSVEIGEF